MNTMNTFIFLGVTLWSLAQGERIFHDFSISLLVIGYRFKKPRVGS